MQCPISNLLEISLHASGTLQASSWTLPQPFEIVRKPSGTIVASLSHRYGALKISFSSIMPNLLHEMLYVAILSLLRKVDSERNKHQKRELKRWYFRILRVLNIINNSVSFQLADFGWFCLMKYMRKDFAHLVTPNFTHLVVNVLIFKRLHLKWKSKRNM